jgi:hypothetical protein
MVVLVVSVLTSVVYGMSYTESQAALSQLSVSCASYGTVYHPPSQSHPLSHYIVTLGVRNPSSLDANAFWAVSASNQTFGYLGVEDDKSFTVPHRESAQATFSLLIERPNVILHPSDLTVAATYKISLFTFDQRSGVSGSLPACT